MKNLVPIIFNGFTYLIHLFVCTQSFIAIAVFPCHLPSPIQVETLFTFIWLCPTALGCPPLRTVSLLAWSVTLCATWTPCHCPSYFTQLQCPVLGFPCEYTPLNLLERRGLVPCCFPPVWI